MDTLFRLVSYHPDQQYHQYTTTTTTTSTSSGSSYSKHPNHVNLQTYTSLEEGEVADVEVEECCNNNFNYYNNNNSTTFMDEDDFSSSSSKHFFSSYHHPQTTTSSATPTPSPTPTNTYTNFSYPTTSTTPPAFEHSDYANFNVSAHYDPNLNVNNLVDSGGKWASEILLDCARALSNRDTTRVQQLMWMLNELSSPYGDVDQKVAAYFMQALFSRMTSSGDRCLRTLASASDRATSFDSTRRTALRFQEASPWSTFGHVASNCAILDALDGESNLHIVDFSNTFCTQWPTLLEALATRSSDETPHLRLTSVVVSAASGGHAVQKVMREIGGRMEKFARLMGVPFKFNFVHHAGDLSGLDLDVLGISSGEALAINCVNTLHAIPTSNGRDSVAASFRRLRPRVVTVVEEEANIGTNEGGIGDEFFKGFKESLRFFSAYFDSLDESFSKTSNERLALERAAGRAIVDLIACEPGESGERRETGSRWSIRMREAGFETAGLSEDGADDVRALLRRYKEGWSLVPAADVDQSASGIFLAWKEQPVVWACAWKP